MPLNIDNLTVLDDVDIPQSASRGRAAVDNPMLPLMQASVNEGTNGVGRNKGIPGVPAGDVRELVNLLRYAANKLDIGARIYLADPDNQELTLGRKIDEAGNSTGLDIVYKSDTTQNYTGPVNVLFRAQKRKAKKGTATETTDVANDDTPGEAEVVSDSPTETDVTGAETVTEITPKRRRQR